MERGLPVTRLLLILLAASFALTMLAAISADPAAERRALLSSPSERGLTEHARTPHAPSAKSVAPIRSASA